MERGRDSGMRESGGQREEMADREERTGEGRRGGGEGEGGRGGRGGRKREGHTHCVRLRVTDDIMEWRTGGGSDISLSGLISAMKANSL